MPWAAALRDDLSVSIEPNDSSMRYRRREEIVCSCERGVDEVPSDGDLSSGN